MGIQARTAELENSLSQAAGGQAARRREFQLTSVGPAPKASESETSTSETSTSETSTWGIKEFAAIFSVTPRTLRFYEDKGLISPNRQNGSRIYGIRDYVRAQRVILAKDFGFSLDDIRDLFAVIDGEVPDKAVLLEYQSRMEGAVNKLRRNRKNIDGAIAELEVVISRIDSYTAQADEDSVFQHAAAYEAMFIKTLADSDEDYILGYPARQPIPETNAQKVI